MDTISVAAVQLTSSSDKKENCQKAARYVQKAAEAQCRLVVLPEHWEWLGPPKEKPKIAEPVEGPSIQFLQELAKKYQIFVVSGSIAEKNGEKQPFNTSVLVHPDGGLSKPYRKIHLFDTEVAGGHKESQFTCPGSEVVIENIGWATVGFSICYDVRFPELYRQLASNGAGIFLIPANFTALTGPPHWEVLVRARAIENQCFVIAADQTGMTGAGWEAHGHSMIVDPWGEVLAMAGREEGIITAKLDLNKLTEVRQKMPVQSHRRL
ncbi:MAG: carbon-nitrogen hydrolase family protein [Deltaproteobacteria bacterium]|nr:carbon-nitrogen hydrolase family protein [Deltaproteobacteria bacterium]MBI4223631.1 carbon-nitrogen hydrolase family protein [Deltaproteobacteria bacterium]